MEAKQPATFVPAAEDVAVAMGPASAPASPVRRTRRPRGFTTAAAMV